MTALTQKITWTSQFEKDADDLVAARMINARNVASNEAGTDEWEFDTHITSASSRPKKMWMTYYADGSSVSSPAPITMKAWRALPTSTGKVFEWEGVVTRIERDYFQAKLKNVKGATSDSFEHAEFSVSDVPIGDRDLLCVGGIFRWVVGLESRSGTRQKYSKVVFRRLPAWTQKSLENEVEKLNKMFSSISWMTDESSGS